MGALRRIILTLLSLSIVAIAVAAIYIAWFDPYFVETMSVLATIYIPWYVAALITLLGVVAIFISLFIMVSPLKLRRKERVIRSDARGNVAVSDMAIETIAITAAKQHASFKDIRVRVLGRDHDVVIFIMASAYADTVLPDMTARIQSDVADAIAQATGLKVKRVDVSVVAASQQNENKQMAQVNSKPRVK